jgi:hypothetical protein
VAGDPLGDPVIPTRGRPGPLAEGFGALYLVSGGGLAGERFIAPLRVRVADVVGRPGALYAQEAPTAPKSRTPARHRSAVGALATDLTSTVTAPALPAKPGVSFADDAGTPRD